MREPANIEIRRFPDDGRTPNHPVLPLMVMRRTGAADADDPAAWFEQRFAANGWSAAWRGGVYPYHHFHTTNHEVLGVSAGSAKLMLGGENGSEFDVGLGDVIVIPAGVGHKCLEATGDFQVVGAYPGGADPDLNHSTGEDLDLARRHIADVPLPQQDPVYGRGGPLCDHWRRMGS